MSLPTRKRISISYTVIGGSWSSIAPEVLRQLPLKNLHWKSKSPTRIGISTIQSLQVDFRPLESYDEKSGGAVPLAERPYLHLLFVLCDDNESYRATVRSQIREWLDGVTSRPNHEWLIVNVAAGRSAGSKFYQRKGSVVDKIRADFNTAKKDRCVHVAQGVSAEDPTTWADFMIKVKEGIITTFDTNVSVYEEDVRKADSQRQLEGWQYTTFFLQKEALADCFETMNLQEEALIQYDELEASFFQTLKENSAAWLGKIGGLSPGDDALPLLETTQKPYRQLIMTNTITIFDFRIYLFARQAAILFDLGRIAEVAKRGAFFISQFARTLRENQDTLGPNFLESWTYSACLNIVDQCTLHAASQDVDRAALDSFVAVKAELLDLARKQVRLFPPCLSHALTNSLLRSPHQLDKIGISSGHLPLSHPFSMSLNEYASERPVKPLPAGARDAVSRKDLLDAIANLESFDKLYVELTNRSIHAYQTSRRKRCSLKLHASLAALEDHRGHLSSAQKLYSQLPPHYVDHRWVKIESSLLSQCTRLQGTLDLPKEQLLSTLALIRAGVEYSSNVWSLSMDQDEVRNGERMEELAEGLMEDVRRLSSMLSKDARLGATGTDSDVLLVEDVEAASIVKLQIPIVGLLAEPTLDVSISLYENDASALTGRFWIQLSIVVEYFTSKRPGTRRLLRRAVRYPVSLPLAVNVQDYFRPDCLLSKFAVTTDGIRTLKIKSAVLEGVEGIQVKSCRSVNAPTLTLLPLQSANFLFKVLKSPAAEPRGALRLSLTYCSLSDELVVKVKDVITQVIKSHSLADDLPWFLETVVSQVESSTDLLAYSRNGSLSHLAFKEIAWVGPVRVYFSKALQEDAFALLKEVYTALAAAAPVEHPDAWRILSIPVDLPTLTILNTVRITPSCTRTEVGQPLPIQITVKPTFNWTNPPMAEPILLSYEMNGTFDDWLVSGRKRGEFVAEVSSSVPFA
ncbi:trafficking protein particle complex subunit 10, partial [Phenoliferia sp. Uapishka_3]